MKFKIYVMLLSLIVLTGCYEDKGNYSYTEVEKLTVTFPEIISAMEGGESIEFDPTVVSSINGTIEDGNPDYTFGCKLSRVWYDENGEEQRWLDMNPEGTKAVSFFANVPAGNYVFWYTVKNNNTGVTFNYEGSCSVLTTTNGWMVLTSNGGDNKARLDMIYVNSKGNEAVRQNVFDGTGPAIYNAERLIFSPNYYSEGEQILLTSPSGGYMLNGVTLQYDESDNIKLYYFLDANAPGEVVNLMPIYYTAVNRNGPVTKLCVTSNGDAYAIWSSEFGASFEDPINTDTERGDPTFKVSPFIGSSRTQPGNSYVALLYDTTNKRFVGYVFNNDNPNRTLTPLTNPTGAKFSFTTGMDIVDMESTAFSDGEVFSVLQDATGKRYVYGIYVNGSTAEFGQDKVYNFSTENFDVAADYAFHPFTSIMYYCKDNKVYGCRFGSDGTSLIEQLELDPSETVTKVKFNILTYGCLRDTDFFKKSEDYRAMQQWLIVGSSTGGENGGIVRFYNVDIITGKLSLIKEFKGFGERIVDVTYREVK